MAKVTQKITPHLWFDRQAEEAAKIYTSIFQNSKIGNISRYGKEGFEIHHMPEGTAMTVEFTFEGQKFLALNGGPVFKFNPSISFHVKCKTKSEVDAIWKKLSKGGTVLMELGKYPWSEKYGWLQDRYGLSWQLIYVGESEVKQKITPVLMFVGKVCGKAEEAVKFYASVFKNAPFDSAQGESKVYNILHYGKGEEPDRQGSVKYAAFTLEGMEFGAMDSVHDHNFTFNEAISFLVSCKNQKEVDYFWKKLSADPKAERCGWLKDKFDLSWQIIPTVLGTMLQDKDKNKVARVTEAFLKMKKFDIAKLKEVYEER